MLIADAADPQRGHTGRIAFGPDPRPIGAFAEQQLRDVWLAVPLPDAVFGNGFEP